MQLQIRKLTLLAALIPPEACKRFSTKLLLVVAVGMLCFLWARYVISRPLIPPAVALTGTMGPLGADPSVAWR